MRKVSGSWWIAVALLTFVVIITAVGRTLSSHRIERASGGTQLGHLIDGVTRDQLNLVVVTLDTTRADRLGAYHNTQIRTPVFDRLAREGVLFEQTEAVAPLTLPAHVSIFTGRFPPEHGVRDNGGFFVSPKEVTLATVLKGAGFQTGA